MSSACPPVQTPQTVAGTVPPHLPLPHAWSLNNFAAAAALWRWHLVAYFLSWPFISCHFFFPEASRVAAAKRDGRWLEVTDTRRHGGRRQQHPAPRLAGRGGAVLWIKRSVLWRRLYGEEGEEGACILKSAYE